MFDPKLHHLNWPWAWLVPAVGFAGALIVVRPGSANFNWYALLIVASTTSSAMLAASGVLPRQRCTSRSYSGQLAKPMMSAASTGTTKPRKKYTPAASTRSRRPRATREAGRTGGMRKF